MTIEELYLQELDYWTHANRKFLGVTPIHEEDSWADINAQLEADCATYWNVPKPCKLAKYLNNGTLNKEAHLQDKYSYRLEMNDISCCIDIYGKYSGKEYKVASMPTPCDDLCWIINKSHYVPRVTAKRVNMSELVWKYDETTFGTYNWKYHSDTKTFDCTVTNKKYAFEPTREEIFNNHLTEMSRALLENILRKPLTVDNFTDALIRLPNYNTKEGKNSIYNFKFSRLDYFEDAVINSAKYAQPIKGYLFGANTIIGSIYHQYTSENYEGCLIRSEGRTFALENFRTCVNIFDSNKNANKVINKKESIVLNNKITVEPKKETNKYTYAKQNVRKKSDDYQPQFCYTQCTGYFDSFKTSTSKAAGRQRMLLDNIVIRHGMLYVVDDQGNQHNMYEYIFDQKASNPIFKRLSCLSEAPFCNNDQPKRIMMNAKMTAQSVTLKEESDPYTHRIKARVGFTDIEGYTYADSIIISESFAKRLRTYNSDILFVSTESNLFKALTDNPIFDLAMLKQIYPSTNEAILDGYENVTIDHIDYIPKKNKARVFLKWEIPFRLGDKITNLHGAKGTVGLILPDNKMPYLTKKVGNMEPGPLEIIISGFSTIRRGSLGQLFEAWALACDIDLSADAKHPIGKDYAYYATRDYADQMKKYSENSIVTFNGETNIIPVGIINIMRLLHHASTKVSCSAEEFAYKRTLRFGEMEKLNLVANDCPNILKEIGIRSVTKFIGSHKYIRDMEATRELPNNPRLSLRFAEIMKSMGYDIKVDGKSLSNSDYSDSLASKEDIDRLNRVFQGGSINDEDDEIDDYDPATDEE